MRAFFIRTLGLQEIDWRLVKSLWRRRLWRKMINYTVASAQYARRDAVLLAYPYQLSMDISTLCTLRCPLCSVGALNHQRPMKLMDLESFKRILDELGPYLLRVDLYIHGEPLMNKHVYEMIAYCKRYGIYVNIDSNMQLLDEASAARLVESGLDHLHASIDGVTQENYEKYRVKGDLELAFRNLGFVVQAKRRLKQMVPVVIWKFIVFRHNEHEVDRAKELAEEIGVDGIFFSAACVGNLFSEIEKWAPRGPQYRMYNDQADAVTRSVGLYELPPVCNLPWVSINMDPDGNIQTCCIPTEPKHDHGRFARGSFGWVWNGARYRQSRRHLGRQRPQKRAGESSNLCESCVEGSSHSVLDPASWYCSREDRPL
ncbi:MAG: radical SAM protein [Elusimicrobiota bacterium]